MNWSKFLAEWIINRSSPGIIRIDHVSSGTYAFIHEFEWNYRDYQVYTIEENGSTKFQGQRRSMEAALKLFLKTVQL